MGGTSLDVRSVDHGVGEIAVGILEDVALAAFDLLARIIATRPSAFRGFDALAVDHSGAWRSVATRCFTSDQQQGMIQ